MDILSLQVRLKWLAKFQSGVNQYSWRGGSPMKSRNPHKEWPISNHQTVQPGDQRVDVFPIFRLQGEARNHEGLNLESTNENRQTRTRERENISHRPFKRKIIDSKNAGWEKDHVSS